MSGDSADLEALFDSIAGLLRHRRHRRWLRPAPATRARRWEIPTIFRHRFDSIDSESAPSAPPLNAVATAAAVDGDEDFPARKRCSSVSVTWHANSHDTLRELGYDKMLNQTMEALPDAKDR